MSRRTYARLPENEANQNWEEDLKTLSAKGHCFPSSKIEPPHAQILTF